MQPSPAPLAADPWHVMSRLLRDLPRRRADELVPTVLTAVRAVTAADVVCWFTDAAGEPVQAVGDRPATAAWCRDLVRQQATRTDGPGHVVLVRVSRVRPVWLIAVRFPPAPPFEPTDERRLALARRMLLQERKRRRGQAELERTLLGLVRGLTAALSAKNPYTCDHSERVARIAVLVGRQMGLSAATVSNLYLAGLLHDIGKIGIDTSVLDHAGPLTPEQRAHIQQHPVIGDQILDAIPTLAALRPAVRNHHERFDGAGYPDGLAGHGIPLLARIMAAADACDAMFSARPYRPGMPAELVNATLQTGAGSHWDPDVVHHLLACRDQVYAIYRKGLGESMHHAVADVLRAHGAR